MDIRQLAETYVESVEKKLRPPRLDKQMQKMIHQHHIKLGLGNFNKHCAPCFGKALRSIHDHYNSKTPKLVKDKMVTNKKPNLIKSDAPEKSEKVKELEGLDYQVLRKMAKDKEDNGGEDAIYPFESKEKPYLIKYLSDEK